MDETAIQENNVVHAVLEGVRLNSIRLPSLPEVAVRVGEVAARPNVTVGHLTEEISRDGALAARIVRIANSPLMRGRSEIRSLNQAITRLGINYVRDLVTAFAVEGAFMPRQPAVRQVLREVWSRNRNTAAACHVLAYRSAKVAPDQAMLAGLLHSIGALPLLVVIDESQAKEVDVTALRALVEERHAELGGVLLRAWRFSEQIARVPEHYRDPSREHEGPPDLVDVVAVAHLLDSLARQPGERPPLWSVIASVNRLGLGDEIEYLGGIEFCDEVSESRSLFG
jgi:HD-like signal output (HDOD) protein